MDLPACGCGKPDCPLGRLNELLRTAHVRTMQDAEGETYLNLTDLGHLLSRASAAYCDALAIQPIVGTLQAAGAAANTRFFEKLLGHEGLLVAHTTLLDVPDTVPEDWHRGT